MKYFNFDIVRCFKDYPDNRNKKIMAEKIAKLLKRRVSLYKDDEEAKTMCELMLKAYLAKLEENTLYCYLIEDGLKTLSEIEREVLESWLWDGLTDIDLLKKYPIQDREELNKIKGIALKHLASSVSPIDYSL